MTNEDRVNPERIKTTIEEWIGDTKQTAFARLMFEALKASGTDELKASTIEAAIPKAKAGNPDAIKQLFGTPARRAAFAAAAKRPVQELEASLAVASSDRPAVFVVASDIGDMNELARLTKLIDGACCSPRIVADQAWRERLREADLAILEAWGTKGWLAELNGDGIGALQRVYEGVATPKAWVAGKTDVKLPRWQAMRLVEGRDYLPTLDPPDFAARLQKHGFVATEPRAHPTKAADGTELQATSFADLACEAGVSTKEEPFVAQAVEAEARVGNWHAAMVEVARGYPVAEVLQHRQLDPKRVPKALLTLANVGYCAKWADDTRAVLSLGQLMGEQTAIGKAAIKEVVSQVRQRTSRAEFMKKNPSVARLMPPVDDLVMGCRARGVALNVSVRDGYHGSDVKVFVEVNRGEDVERVQMTLTPPIARTSEPVGVFGRAAEQFKARVGQPASLGNPLVELMTAAAMAPAATLPLLRAPETHDGQPPELTAADSKALPDYWDQAERGAAALQAAGPRLDDPLSTLQVALSRPIGSIVALWPDARILVSAKYEGLYESTPLERQGAVAMLLGQVQDREGQGQGPSGSSNVAHVVAAILWLKAAMRRGEHVELLEQAGRRLVMTDLRGLKAEVTAWSVPPSPPVLSGVLVMAQHRHDGYGSRGTCPMPCHAFTTHQLRYADKVTYPTSLWLGSDSTLFRIDFGSPAGLLDWEPMTAAEQAMIQADDDAAAAADDDD